MDNPPLLQDFFGSAGGTVLYKGYYPNRGDDVLAVQEIAKVLPHTVVIHPMPPRVGIVHDLQALLAQLLRELNQGDPAKQDGAETVFPDLQSEEVLESLIQYTLLGIDKSLDTGKILEKLKADARLWKFLCNLVVLPKYDAPELETMLHIPRDVPLLIVGRPEFLAGYDDPKSDLRRILDTAGYPNRFYHLDPGPDSLDLFTSIRDRKTRSTYVGRKDRTAEAKKQIGRLEDVGFLFYGRSAHDQGVIVASGVSSIGTFTAVRLLTSYNPVFKRAVETVAKSAERWCIDIAFHSRLCDIPRHTFLPIIRTPDQLQIHIINPGDTVGYRWSRNSMHKLDPLIQAWSASKGGGQLESRGENAKAEPYMRWSWEGKERTESSEGVSRLLRVRIEATEYYLSESYCIRPSARLGEVLDIIHEDLKLDRIDWRNKLRLWANSNQQGSALTGLVEDACSEALRPVLLLGPTGSGKDVVADFIARGWNGDCLPKDEVDEWIEAATLGGKTKGKRKDSSSHFEVSQAYLDNKVKDLLALSSAHIGKAGKHINELMYSLSPPAFPETLLDAELFGNAADTFTDVGPRMGAFLMAGTGVLFLDELLELDSNRQTRFLVALQKGQVRPLGAPRSYGYLARVVAATNRAGNEQELEALAQAMTVRPDLIARFGKRYCIPPMSERPMEIITILIELLRQRLSSQEVNHVRLSRPAFEALITYHFRENIRSLKRLADTLPSTLVESFKSAASATGSVSLKTQAVRLEHLKRMGIGHSAEHADGIFPPSLNVTAEEEVDFYEFSLGEPLAVIDPLSEEEVSNGIMLNDVYIPPDASEGAKRIFRKLHESQDHLLKLREKASVIFGDDAKSSAEKLEDFLDNGVDSESLAFLYQLIIQEHHNPCYQEGLMLKRRQEWYHKQLWAQLQWPLEAFTGQFERDDEREYCARIVREKAKSWWSQHPAAVAKLGRRVTPEKWVFLSFLCGKVVQAP